MDRLEWFSSYYGNMKNLNGMKVSISRFIPFEIGRHVDFQDIRLAPTPEILHSARDVYIEKFEEIMNKTNIKDIIEEYEKIAKERGYSSIFLLCYETPDDFCHRHLVAEKIRKYTPIEEYEKEVIFDF